MCFDFLMILFICYFTISIFCFTKLYFKPVVYVCCKLPRVAFSQMGSIKIKQTNKQTNKHASKQTLTNCPKSDYVTLRIYLIFPILVAWNEINDDLPSRLGKSLEKKEMLFNPIVSTNERRPSECITEW